MSANWPHKAAMSLDALESTLHSMVGSTVVYEPVVCS